MTTTHGSDPAKGLVPARLCRSEPLPGGVGGRGGLRVSSVDDEAWLHAAHELLRGTFAPDVLGPADGFATPSGSGEDSERAWRRIVMVAWWPDHERALLAGVVSGSLIHLRLPIGTAAAERYVFAVGHQATDTRVLAGGIRGVGTLLWRAASAEAAQRAAERRATLEWSFLESERRALAFWASVGYRWPEGLTYWQPPLAFERDGSPLGDEVPEVPLLLAYGSPPPDEIPSTVMCAIVESVLREWYVEPQQRTHSTEAMARIESLIVDRLLARVCASMEGRESLRLVDPRGRDPAKVASPS